MRSKIREAEMGFLHSRAGLEGLRHQGGAQSRTAAHPHGEEPDEAARASGQDDNWTPPWGGVPGMPTREETLERSRFSSGLGTIFPEELVEVDWERALWASLLKLLPL